MKAAAFRRGGFFTVPLLAIVLAAFPSRAEGTANVPLIATEREEIVRLFVLANVEFTVFHELGHAAMHLFPIPIFGMEEDAADQIATTAMILKYGADVDPVAIDRLLAVSSEWLSEWHQETKAAGNAHQFWDSHSLAIQRFYNVNCLLYGANPDELAFMLDTEALPAERGFNCDQAYEQALFAYRWMIKTHGRQADSMVPYNGIVVRYDEPRSPRQALIHQWMVESGLTQELAARATEFLPWPQPIPLIFENCPGNPDAHYNRNVGEIVVCYELLELFYERSERSLSRNVSLICQNAGLRRLFGDRLECPPAPLP